MWQMINRLKHNLSLITIIGVLAGCSKDEVETHEPTIKAPAAFELYDVETSDVEVYTKDGKVTGDKAKHLGGSKYLFSTIVANVLKAEFKKQDTVIVYSEFKPDPSIDNSFSHTYTASYQKQNITLNPLKLTPVMVLEPSASEGYRLENDFKKLEELHKLFIVKRNDNIITIERYQEVFLRQVGSMKKSLFLTVNTDDDKYLHNQFLKDSDTLWIRKQTIYLKKVEE